MCDTTKAYSIKQSEKKTDLFSEYVTEKSNKPRKQHGSCWHTIWVHSAVFFKTYWFNNQEPKL